MNPGEARTHWAAVLVAALAGVAIAMNVGKLPVGLPALRAEFGLTLVLALLKQLPFFVAAQREHAWRRALPARVAGRTLGILGLGAIGEAWRCGPRRSACA